MKTIEECEAFLEKVGIATVLPAKDALFPCLLWEARGDRERRRVWDAAIERVWTWKDDLPAQKTAWLGRLFGDRVVLLHSRLLPPFLAWRGRPKVDDLYQEGLLTNEAFRVWSTVEQADEPIGRAPLRRGSGLSSKEDAARFDRACRDLERRLLLTRAGRAEVASGWDSNSYARVESWFSTEWEQAEAWESEEAEETVRAALQHAAPEATERQVVRWMREV